jgi:hypothetical protein
MNNGIYLTPAQITEMAQAILTTLEVTPLDHGRKCEIAMEYAIDEWGISPRISATLLAVKLANLGWEACRLEVQRLIEEQS